MTYIGLKVSFWIAIKKNAWNSFLLTHQLKTEFDEELTDNSVDLEGWYSVICMVIDNYTNLTMIWLDF